MSESSRTVDVSGSAGMFPVGAPASANGPAQIGAPPQLGAPAPGARVEREFTVPQRSQLSLVTHRFLRHRLAMGALALLMVLIVLVFIGPVVFHLDYTAMSATLSAAPSFSFPMGTDGLGHNYLALVLRGAHQSLVIAFFVAAISSGVGAPYGTVAGYYGGKVDAIMMRIVDIILVLPFLVVVGALAEHFHGTWYTVAILLGVTTWVVNARITRADVLSVKNKDFVEAARALGASDLRIMFRHLLPNVTGALVVQTTLSVAAAILAEAGLSFVGLGIQPPDTSLGLLANQAANAIATRPWLFYSPCVMILVICLCVNFIGDGLRDALDPRQVRR
ncbi:MAG TPA: ABC transporter permease [Micromonosporaceae bacterium]